mmetsp:Transcript_23932/g.43597  ORF Transcript_23932/g.43597 Transcript_23932/m.43597 type:complete len:215 (-) Transcript_23932:1-645(-)
MQAPLTLRRLDIQRILRRQLPRIRKPGDHPKSRPTRLRGNHRIAIVKEARIPPKPVDQKPLDHCRIVHVNHSLRTHDLRNHAAPINVARQDHRTLRGPRKAHIGNVPGAQVHLRRTARALDQNQIMFRFQPVKAVQNSLHQPRLHLCIVPRLHGGDTLTLHHNLRAHIRLRLQQNRVHISMRVQPTGHGLQRLRPPNLAPVRGHGGIVGHILRL